MLVTNLTPLSEAFAALAADMRADGRRMVLAHAFDPVERLRAYVLLALADLIATLAAFIADWEATRHLPRATPPATPRAHPRRAHARAESPRTRAARARQPRATPRRRRPAVTAPIPTPRPRHPAPTPRAPGAPQPIPGIHAHRPPRCRQIASAPAMRTYGLNVTITQ